MSPSSNNRQHYDNDTNMVLPPAPNSTPGRRRQRSCSAPNSPTTTTPSSTSLSPARHHISVTTRQPVRRGQSLPRKRPTPTTTSPTRRNLLFLSPRVGTSDDEIFPQTKNDHLWKNGEHRWKHLSAQAGQHQQDGSVLDLSSSSSSQHHRRRHCMTPATLQVGMPSAAAARVKTLYLPVECELDKEINNNKTKKNNNDQEHYCYKGLPEWLDVVSSKFPNLEHLYLVEEKSEASLVNSTTTRSSTVRTKVKASESDKEEMLTPSKSRRLRRLYVLYRLPDLLSIDGNPVTRQERQLARPPDPNGEKVNRDEWVDSSSLYGNEFDDKKKKMMMNTGVGNCDSKDGSMLTPPNKSVAGDAVEVCLSGSIKMTDVQGTKKELVERVRIPLLDSDECDDGKKEDDEGDVARKAPQCMDPLDLDQFEYVSVESSAHCDWGVACGSLSLPYFRPDIANRIKNSAENSKSRFRISLRQRRGCEQQNQQVSDRSTTKSNTPHGLTKVEKKLAAGGSRMREDVENDSERIHGGQSREKGLMCDSLLDSDECARTTLPDDDHTSSVECSERSTGTLSIGKKSPQIAHKRFAATGKRDNVLLLLDDIEQTRSPRIQIGLVEQVQSSPRFQSVTGVEVKLSSPTRQHQESRSPFRQTVGAAKSSRSLKKQDSASPKIEKKLGSGGSRSQSALLEVTGKIDEIELTQVETASSISALGGNTVDRRDEQISESPQRPGGSSVQKHGDPHVNLPSPARPTAGNLSGKTTVTMGSPSRRIPASKSLTSPFPMQFRSRTCITKHLPPDRDIETAPSLEDKTVEVVLEPQSRPSPHRELNISTDSNDRGQIPSPPPPPPHDPSPSLHTIDSVKPSSPIRLLRVQSSPSKLGRRALLGDLPPPCPGGGRQRLLPSPPRRLRPKHNFVKWRQKQTARSTSIMDTEEDDEYSSDEENLELD